VQRVGNDVLLIKMRSMMSSESSSSAAPFGLDQQGDLFGVASDVDPVGAADVAADLVDLRSQLPVALRLGTSSWSFPGWAGIVYARRVGEQLLARDGLRAYAKHPLLGAVSVDRSFYAPMTTQEFARYADKVPADFRFVVKAHAALITPLDRHDKRAVGSSSDHFLDSDYAIERVIEPAVAGLGERLGAILFQFSPLSVRYTREPSRFVSALGDFLERLPRGPQYAVEIRNREFLTRDYTDALARSGVTHCFNVHPRMPDVLQQADLLGPAASLSGTVVVRWMLHPTQEYQAARERYFPFDRLIDPDARSRTAISQLLLRLRAQGNETIVIANNKAEGSAPLSLVGLARELVARQPLGSSL